MCVKSVALCIFLSILTFPLSPLFSTYISLKKTNITLNHLLLCATLVGRLSVNHSWYHSVSGTESSAAERASERHVPPQDATVALLSRCFCLTNAGVNPFQAASNL